MPGKLSNPRDLLVLLLGEILFVERRLAGGVLQQLIDAVHDEGLRDALRAHLDETRQHVERAETAFRRIEVAPTANLTQVFESAVAEHDEVAKTIAEPRLADVFHAQAALHTEHWELGAYRTVFALAPREVRDVLKPSYDEEGATAKLLVAAIDRLARGA
jgi:ferritin-like metal-binding protein YciE